MRIARCTIERSDLPVGRHLTVTGTNDDNAMRRAIALNDAYWPSVVTEERRLRRREIPIQPCAIVEFGKRRDGAYLRILDHDLIALTNAIRPDAPAQRRV